MHAPPLHRIIRVVNILIAIALAAALAVVYWLAWRPLPQTSGTLRAPVAQTVTVDTDALGVPHISAVNESDLLFAQGFVTAQERMWQMDGLRRVAAGELAEIVGPAGLESDQDSRRLRMRRIAEQAYAVLPADQRASLAAYARGVNYYLETRRGRLPLEFTLLGYDPRPWSAIDTLLIGLHMVRTLTTTWRQDLAKGQLLSGGADPSRVDFLFPPRSGYEIHPGSNAWAVSGAWTRSGRPLLSNDMHLEWSIPGIWYMSHLKAPGLNVSGVCLPGAPGVIVGHNDRIAWGITNLGYDVQDLYIEQFDERTGRYLFRGRVEQALPEREIIRVKGAKPIEFINWITRHGPIFVADGDRRLALRWVAAEPGVIGLPILAIDRARTWQEFTAALARFPAPGSNLIYADVDGNIGYHATGMLPIRKTYSGDVPVDGSSGNYEWEGFIPFDQLPSAFNPPSGLIASGNQNPFPANYPYAAGGNFMDYYRVKQIRDRLSARKGWRAEEMPSVQKDVYSAFSRFLAQSLVAACDRLKVTNPVLQEPLRQLRAWNGQMEKDQAAPLIAALAFQHLRRAVMEKAAPGKGPLSNRQPSSEILEKFLRTRPSGWFPDYDQMLVRVLADAVEEGTRIQGRRVEKWEYGRYLNVLIPHPVGHRLRFLASYFDLGPVPMGGSGTTVKQTTWRLGPSMRMNADLADWDQSLLMVPIGQSGHVLSRHYKDEWDRFDAGASFPMQFGKVDVKATLALVPE